jgi:CBS domain containing-hemolysin-like protein
MIATATRRMGLLPRFQEEIIHRAIELSHVIVREIMTPRGTIFALPATMSLEQASARIVDEGHTRVPVYDPARGSDHIIGIIHAKDIARLMHFRAAALTFGAGGGESGLTLRELMREVLFVPETKLAVELLQEFQERRRQIAIVVDEFGSTVGLVTAEDALEQVVGELRDEFDELDDATPVRVAATSGAAGGLLLDGSTTLRDLSTQLGWEFPRQPGVETLAGFLLAELGHIPATGETVEHGRRTFHVAEMAGRRISRVRVEEQAAKAGPAELATEDDGLEVSA